MPYLAPKILPNLAEMTEISDADLFYVVGSDYKTTSQTFRKLMNPCLTTTPKLIDYAIPASECDGRWFSNRGCIAIRYFGLPTVVDNLVVAFLVEEAHYLAIDPKITDRIVQITTYNGQAIKSNVVGSSIVLRATSNNWYIIRKSGTWNVIP